MVYAPEHYDKTPRIIDSTKNHWKVLIASCSGGAAQQVNRALPCRRSFCEAINMEILQEN